MGVGLGGVGWVRVARVGRVDNMKGVWKEVGGPLVGKRKGI